MNTETLCETARKAALDGNIEKLVKCLVTGDNPTIKTFQGEKSLMLAARIANRQDIIKLLLMLGDSIEPSDFYFASFWAKQGNFHHARELLDAGRITIDQSVPEHPHLTLLLQACDNGKPEVVKFLLERGANPNIYRRIDNQNCLNVALEKKHPDIARMLVEAGCPPINTAGGTPVVYSAAVCGDVELMKELIKYDPRFSVSPTFEDVRELAFYFLSRQYASDSVEMLEYILSLHPDCNLRMTDREGRTMAYWISAFSKFNLYDYVDRDGYQPPRSESVTEVKAEA